MLSRTQPRPHRQHGADPPLHNTHRRPPRIIILNTYSWYNKGDAAIVLGTVEAIRAAAPGAEITLVSLTPDVDRAHYAVYDVRVVSGPFAHVYQGMGGRLGRIARFLVGTVAVLAGALVCGTFGPRTAYRLPLPAEAREVVAQLAASDFAVSCGGGFWQDSHGRGVYLHVVQVLSALWAGLPVVGLGQSVGPFRSRWRRWVVGRVLARMDALVVREAESLPTVRAMRIPSARVHRGADMAFVLHAPGAGPGAARTRRASPTPQREERPAGNRLRIGVTARAWVFPNSADPAAAQRRYEQALAGTLNTLMARYEAEVVFLPQVIGPAGDDDLVVERRIAGLLSDPERVTVVAVDLAPQELIAFIQEAALDVLLAMRFHSAIFAMVAGVPVVGIAYEHKTTGIMNQMGLGEWAVPVEEATEAKLTQLMIDLIAARTKITPRLQSGVSKMRALAMQSVLDTLPVAEPVRLRGDAGRPTEASTNRIWH